MPVRHLGTFSLLGGRSQRGYTEEQQQSLRRSTRIKRGREEREARLKREELVSEEKRARMRGEADIGYARVAATGKLAERGMTERGMTERARMTTAREYGKQRLAGAQERATPTYRTEERELALDKYATTVGSLATEFTRFETTPEGETYPVVSTAARKIAQKYQNLYLTDPERAVESVKSELAAKKVGMDRAKMEIARWASETGAVPPEELDIIEEAYGDEAETLITKWTRKMRTQEAEARREEEEAIAEPGVSRVGAETWGESLLGRAYKSTGRGIRSIRERRKEVAKRRRIGGPVGLEY